MDGLILFCIAAYYCYKGAQRRARARAIDTKIIESDIPVQTNPKFFRDWEAFTKLYNFIMGKGGVK